MGLPTTGEATIEIDAPPEAIYDLVTDVTRMGEWSPECVKCEWQGAPGQVGSTFKGHNRSGPARWKTVARVEVADRPSEFTFATLYKDGPSTRWSYRFEGTGPTKVTESFEAIKSPPLIAFAEKVFLRNRQQQMEEGMRTTLARIKAAVET